jgi:tetratricopeptide (TPR) repeat protein
MVELTSEVDRLSNEINRKPVGEIERTTREIKEFCDNFVRVNGELIGACVELDSKCTEKIEKVSQVLREFRKKSAGIEEAWRLNEGQFKDGLERDTFERKIRELTQDMASLKFDFDRCRAEIEAFEKKLESLLQNNEIIASQSTATLHKSSKKVKIEIGKTQTFTSTRNIKLEQQKADSKELFSDPDAFIRIGISYAESKKPEKAKECFESALSVRPNNTTILYHLGLSNSTLGLHSDAIKNFKKVLANNPEHIEAICELGYCFGQIGHHKEACKCFKKLVSLNPKDEKAWVGLGVAHYSSGNLKEAKGCLEKAIQIKKQYGLAWYNLGLVYSGLGYGLESKRCYDEAAKLGNP